MNTNRKPLPLMLAAVLLSSQAGWASTDAARIHEDVTVTPIHGISHADEAAVSRAALNVLKRINDARASIASKDETTARAALKQADTLLDLIAAALPTNRIRDQIKLAESRLQYDHTSEVQPDLAPIYVSMDEVDDFSAVPLAKAHLDQARAHLKAGDKTAAKKELEATNATLLYQDIDLPLSATRHFIHAAEAQLAKHAFKLADLHLQAAQDNVIYYSTFADEPLVPAGANLVRAQVNLKARRMDAARGDVKRAVTLFEQAAARTDDSAKSEAQQLLADAKALGSKMDKGGQDVTGDLALIVHRTHALVDRSIDYTSVGWSRFHGSSELKKSLIEAKLHARYAAIDAFIGNNPGRARTDLADVARYLSQAHDAKEVAPSTRARILSMQHTLAAIRQPGAAVNPVALHALTASLSQTILSL